MVRPLLAWHLSASGGSTRYQPVMIERSSLIGPAATIMSMWTMKKPTSSSIMQKWMVRAVCRPPKQSARNGITAFMRRRHREAGQDDERQDDEEHAAIGQLLQRVVLARMMEPEPGVVDDVARQFAQIVGLWREIAAQMTVDQAADKPAEHGQ